MIVRGAVLGGIAIGWVALLVRVVGLRSFSKMTSFDFVTTLAMGSLTSAAAMVDRWQGFAQALAAMAGLFVVQWLTAKVRKKAAVAERLIENTPVLLMEDGAIIEKALSETRVARDDVFAKLRQANVSRMDQVRAVVLETTGDVSVLHGADFEPVLLEGVRRIES